MHHAQRNGTQTKAAGKWKKSPWKWIRTHTEAKESGTRTCDFLGAEMRLCVPQEGKREGHTSLYKLGGRCNFLLLQWHATNTKTVQKIREGTDYVYPLACAGDDGIVVIVVLGGDDDGGGGVVVVSPQILKHQLRQEPSNAGPKTPLKNIYGPGQPGAHFNHFNQNNERRRPKKVLNRTKQRDEKDAGEDGGIR